MANKKITDLMSGTPARDSLLESAIDISETMDSRKVTAGAIADLASANVAAPYNSATTYAIGQYCLYEGDIYRCIAITTGTFDATKWTQIVVTSEFRRVVEITSADYALLSSAEKNNGTLYILTDEETTADDIPYSSGVSVADKLDSLSTTDIHAVKGSYSGIKGVYGGYISGSKNYFDFFIPCNTNGLTTITNVSFTSISVLTASGRSDNPFSSYSVDVTPMGLFVDCRFTNTQAASISGVVTFDGMSFTAN